MSLLPKRGVCFSCGHDHGDGMGSPDLLRGLTARGEEVAALQATIADLRGALAKAEAVPIGADERAAFEAWYGSQWPLTLSAAEADPSGEEADCMRTTWSGWEARAAVAQRAGSADESEHDDPTHANHPGHHDGMTCERAAQVIVDLIESQYPGSSVKFKDVIGVLVRDKQQDSGRDAARYRWLLEQGLRYSPPGGKAIFDIAEMNSAIDAAMAAQQGEKGDA